jgi:predicted DNA repair protein MutK
LEQSVHGVPAVGGVLGWLVNTLVSALLGLLVGTVVVAAVAVLPLDRLRRTKGGSSPDSAREDAPH